MTVAYELGPKAYTRLIRIKITRVLRAPNKLKCRLSCTHHQSMQLLTLIFLSLASVPPPKYAPPPTPPGAAAHCARRALASLWLVLAPCLRCPHPIPTVGAPIPEVVSKWFPRDCLRWVCVFAPWGPPKVFPGVSYFCSADSACSPLALPCVLLASYEGVALPHACTWWVPRPAALCLPLPKPPNEGRLTMPWALV